MNLFGITSIMIFFSSLGFGFSLYNANRNSPVTKSWLAASSAIALWGLGLYGVTSAGNAESAMRWQYLLDVAAIFIPVLYFQFAAKLVGAKITLLKYFSFATAAALAIFSFSPLFKQGITSHFGFYWINPGPYYQVFPAFFALYIGLSLFLFAHAYWSNDNKLFRAQIRNTLIAGVIGFSGGMTNFFPQLFNVYPFGNYFILLYIFFMTYGVLRYKLLSAKVVSTQLFAGAIVLVFLINVLRPTSVLDWFVDLLLFVLVTFFSVLMVRGVYREVEQREKIETLAKNLQDANSQLEKANARLREVDQLKSEFVSLATHQIRGPLAAIKGYASLILEGDFGKVTDTIKDAVDKIFQSSQSLVSVVEDFLNISRIELGRMKYDFIVLDLSKLVTEIIAELKPTIEAKGLSFESHIDPGIMVKADTVKIKQVFANLIDNSLKYTKEGRVDVFLSKDGDKAHFMVKDTGIGIPKETIPQLFKKFTRAEDASKTNIMGTGLGLYVASEMVKAHHGRIWVESDGAGKGASFHVELECQK